MDIDKYINSGLLELYVAGVLTDEEAQDISDLIKKHPELLKEVLAIEDVLLKLSHGFAPKSGVPKFDFILSKLESTSTITDSNEKKSIKSLIPYFSWAAVIALCFGMFWLINKNIEYKDKLIKTTEENTALELKNNALQDEVNTVKESFETTKSIVEVLRNESIKTITLSGQKASPTSYAKIYWDQANKYVYLDAKGLPAPPKGKVYQLWSLELNPLDATNLGVLNDYLVDSDKFFKIENTNVSEAFGITLEPEGGSASPSLDQLYALGQVGASRP